MATDIPLVEIYKINAHLLFIFINYFFIMQIYFPINFC